jgi:hypothetical protein
MKGKVAGENQRERWCNREKYSAGDCVADTLPDQDSDVEQPVTRNRDSKRYWNR